MMVPLDFTPGNGGEMRTIGKSQGYLPLPVEFHEYEGYPAMTSVWEDPDTKTRVLLTLLGTGHPPVMMQILDA